MAGYIAGTKTGVFTGEELYCLNKRDSGHCVNRDFHCP